MLNHIVAYLYNKKNSKLRKKFKKLYPNSIVSTSAALSKLTILEGYNVINDNSNIVNSSIGCGTIIGSNTNLPNCKIGKFCSISWNVTVSDACHPTSFVSTYPCFYHTCNNYPLGRGEYQFNEFLKTNNNYSLEIGNDVWIGEKVLLKGGIRIGDGAIIGFGAVVTKDVPPYSIVAGVPATVIRYRFNQETIAALLKIKWWNWPIDLIIERRNEFTNLDSFILKYGQN